MARRSAISPRVVIFGAGRMAQFISAAIESDSGREVVGFCVDPGYQMARSLLGRPVVPVAEVADLVDLATTEALVAVGPQRGLRLREEGLRRLRDLGLVVTHHVSAHAHVWRDLVIRPNVIIHAGAVIDPFVRLEEGVTIRSNATIGHHSEVAPSTFVASGAVLGGGVMVGNRCFIGLGSVIRDGVTLAPETFVGAGAVVTEDTEPGVYVGVPARRLPGRTIFDAT